MSALQLLVLASAVACLGSFIYGMQCFFVKPDSLNGGMKLVYVVNAVFGGLHLAAIVVNFEQRPWANLTGVLLYALAGGLFWWAIHVNRRRKLSFAFSSDQPEHLVTSGPYGLVRHPFYVAYLCAWVAGSVAVGDYRLMSAFVVTLIIYRRAAAGEERKFLDSGLARAYAAYQDQVGGFWPRRRRPAPSLSR